MAKRRKTREQKKLADLRHNFIHSYLNQPVFTAKTKPQTKIVESLATKQPTVAATTSYPFLAKDLGKTGILTLAILASQIALYFLLTNHALKIPGLSY
jgi:hypothetical protein